MAKKRPVVRVRKVAPPPTGVPVPNPMRVLSDTGLLWKLNASVLHPLGFGLAADESAPGGFALLDYRGDPSQVFDPEDFASGSQRFDAYMDAAGRRTMAARAESLGFHTQKSPEGP